MPTYDEALVELAKREVARRQAMTHTDSSEAKDANASMTWGDVGERAIKGYASYGRGAGDVFKTLVGLPMDIVQGFTNATAGGPFAPADFPAAKIRGGSEDVQTLANMLPDMYEPENIGEKRIRAVSRGAHGIIAPGNRVRSMFLGGASGGAGQAMEENMPDSPKAKAAAEISVLLAGLPALRTPKTIKTVQGAVDEIGPERLAEMKKAQSEATATIGAPTVASHFAPDNTGLSALVQEISNSPQGAPLREALRREQSAMGVKTNQFVEGVSKQAEYPKSSANQLMEAIQKAMQAPYKALTKKVKPFYDKGNQEFVTPEALQQLVTALKKIPDEKGIAQTANPALAVERIAAQVEGAPTRIPAVPGTPPSASKVLGPDGQPLILPGTAGTPEIIKPLSATKLDSIGKGASTHAEQAKAKNASAIDKENAVALSAAAEAIKDTTVAASSSIAEGKRLYTEGMVKLKPHATSSLASLASKKSRQAGDGNFSVSQRFLQNDNTAASDVRRVGESLRAQDPQAMAIMVGQNVRSMAEKARSPGEFADLMIGSGPNAMQKGNVLQESVRQNALALGKTAAEADTAASEAYRLFDTIRTVERDQAKLAGTVQTGAREIAGSNPGSTLMTAISPFGLYLRAFAEAGPLQNAIQRRVYDSLAKTLSTSQGIDRLIEIAKYSGTEHKLKVLANGLWAFTAQQDNPAK